MAAAMSANALTTAAVPMPPSSNQGLTINAEDVWPMLDVDLCVPAHFVPAGHRKRHRKPGASWDTPGFRVRQLGRTVLLPVGLS
jgi:hypothetical protein